MITQLEIQVDGPHVALVNNGRTLLISEVSSVPPTVYWQAFASPSVLYRLSGLGPRFDRMHKLSAEFSFRREGVTQSCASYVVPPEPPKHSQLRALLPRGAYLLSLGFRAGVPLRPKLSMSNLCKKNNTAGLFASPIYPLLYCPFSFPLSQYCPNISPIIPIKPLCNPYKAPIIPIQHNPYKTPI